MRKQIAKIKGGRPSKDQVRLIQKRKELIIMLLTDTKETFSRTDVAFIFGVHPAQVTRVIEEDTIQK